MSDLGYLGDVQVSTDGAEARTGRLCARLGRGTQPRPTTRPSLSFSMSGLLAV